MTCETFFRELGRAVERDWAAQHFDERSLPEIAVRHLERAQPSRHVTPLEIARYALFERDRVVGAREADSEFGQPNLIVFAAERFYIEALFWLDGSTTVHQHGFSGAFHVLEGGSVHTRLEFTETQQLNSGFKVGHLTQKTIELLRKGDTRAIVSGRSMIHSLFHLDHPSVSIVIRTVVDPGAEVQYDYASPSIARDPFHKRPFAKLAGRTLQMLREIKTPDFKSLLTRFLRTCEVRDAFECLLTAVAKPDSEWVFDVLAELSDAPYASVLPQMKECLTEHLRVSAILGLRGEVTERESRLTLGLLVNSRDRETLYRLLKDAFPQSEPREKFLSALRTLASAGIGFPENDSSVELVGHLLDGKSDEGVVAELIKEFGPEAAEMRPAILESCAVLRKHPLLTALLPRAETA